AKELDAPAAVLEIGKGEPALAPDGTQPPGDADRAALQLGEAVQNLARRVGAFKAARVGGRARLKQAAALVHAGGDLVVQVRGLDVIGSCPRRLGRASPGRGRVVAHHRVTSKISYLSTPSGALTSTTVPAPLPMMAWPTGDSLEIRLLKGSASAEPTT